ncbi:MAG: ferritin-like domain-containing protein [Actinomycetota bacterium]
MDIDSPATPTADAADGSSLRRRLLGAGLVGLAGSLLPTLASRAGATSVPPDSTPAATTTAPPRRPTSDDAALLGFAQQVELAAVVLYDQALAGRQSDGANRSTLLTIRESHQAYAQALSAILGKSAPDVPAAEIVDQYGAAFTGLPGAMLTAAAELENIAVATHTELVGALQGTDGTALIASILVVEARHVVVLLDMAEQTDLDALLVNDAAALSAEG